MAIAVSNAGGLGSIPCALLDLASLGRELQAVQSATPRPFNVNFFCHEAPDPDVERERAWRDALAPYYREFGIDASNILAGPGRTPFTNDAADVLETFKPPIVSFHFGLPTAALLARVKAWGAVVLSSATTVDEARWLEARGVDAIIAQGSEAGGHRGMFLSTDLTAQRGMSDLVAAVVRVVNVPVIAAGGIADARSVASALALGACGVQVGTSYLLCPEATTSAVHRTALSNGAAETAITNLFTGRPARGILNRLMKELGPMSATAPAFPLAAAALAPLRAEGEKRSSGDFSPLWCGTNASGCRSLPAAELTAELAAGL